MYDDYSHRVVVKEDGIRSLIISPAKPEDSGEYTVIAESSAGKAVSTMCLTVIGELGGMHRLERISAKIDPGHYTLALSMLSSFRRAYKTYLPSHDMRCQR